MDKNINWVTCGVKEDGVVHYDEQFPNQLEKLYGGKSGFIYKSNDAELFTPGKSRGIVVSKSPIAITDYE